MISTNKFINNYIFNINSIIHKTIIHILVGVYPSTNKIVDCLNFSSRKDYLFILKIYEIYSLYPSQIGANFAAIYGKEDIYKYLKHNNIHCKSSSIQYIIDNGHTSIIRLLKDRNIYIDPMMLNDAIKNGHINIVLYILHSYRLKPCSNNLYYSASYNHIKLFKHFIEHYRLLPNFATVNIIILKHFNILYNYLFDNNFITLDKPDDIYNTQLYSNNPHNSHNITWYYSSRYYRY